MSKLVIVAERAQVIKNVIEAVKELVPEATLIVEPAGLRLKTLDTAHVAFVHLFIASETFLSYKMVLSDKKQTSIKLGVSLTELDKILKCGNATDQLRFFYDDVRKPSVLQVSFAGGTTASFDMKLIDTDSEDVAIPNFDYKSQDLLPCTDYNKICKNLTRFSGDVTITRVPAGFEFASNGTGTQRASFSYAVSTLFVEMYEETFSLKYLEQFSKASSMSTHVSLSVAPDLPMLVRYLMDGTGSFIDYYLAAKSKDE